MPGTIKSLPYPGLGLRAWALVSVAGALIKGSANVASASRLGPGVFMVTLGTAMADTNAVCDIRAPMAPVASQVNLSAYASAVTTIYCQCGVSASDADPLGPIFVAVYG